MKNPDRRKNYYIKKDFQRNFIIKFCLLVLAGSVISGIIIYAMSRTTVTTTFVNSKLTIKSTADFIMPAVLLASAVVIVITGIAAIAITLFTSHKIAGPLYRLEKDIDEITAGNLDISLNLRRGDEIKPVAASLNRMVKSIKDRITTVKEELVEVENELTAAPNAASENIKKRIRRAKDTINMFNT